MFAQVIQGRAKDAQGLTERMQIWDRELKPGAEGFLGSTAGVSEAGEFIAVARFESADAARRNSDRAEQGAWWAETEKLLEEGVRFYDCTDVELFLDGGSDDAGFVQVIQGRAKDRQRLRELESQAESWTRENRPEVIGGIIAWQGDDFSQFVYFTSEAEAREGEKKQGPAESGANYEDWSELVEDMKFIDLRDPWMSSP